MSADAKQEREIAVKAVLRSKVTIIFTNTLYRRKQASFVRESQAEHNDYYAKLHNNNLENDRELGEIAKKILNAFEMEKKVFRCYQLLEENPKFGRGENAVRSASLSLGHLNIFGKTLSRYANAQEVTTNRRRKLSTQQELQEFYEEFDTKRTGMFCLILSHLPPLQICYH
ncbi:7601_t:CDS:2 [Paraglomus occultum]|uniref:7601_t:CDS:1 n=1 Tax=Paraglomus occultum TaxID=144539 RepID=A0A9N8WEW6_9GLOM|nr:7601_t:CDS:2 [Paraglomus occultum]